MVTFEYVYNPMLLYEWKARGFSSPCLSFGGHSNEKSKTKTGEVWTLVLGKSKAITKRTSPYEWNSFGRHLQKIQMCTFNKSKPMSWCTDNFSYSLGTLALLCNIDVALVLLCNLILIVYIANTLKCILFICRWSFDHHHSSCSVFNIHG